MAKYLLFAFLCALCSFFTSAQENTTLQKYDRLTIQYDGDNKFFIGNEKFKRSEINNLLSANAASASEYAVSKKYMNKAGYFALGGLVCLIGGLTQINKNTTLSWVLLGSSAAANFISIPFSTKGKKHFQKAVWLYNRAVIY